MSGRDLPVEQVLEYARRVAPVRRPIATGAGNLDAQHVAGSSDEGRLGASSRLSPLSASPTAEASPGSPRPARKARTVEGDVAL
jgi:hypothetical protein